MGTAKASTHTGAGMTFSRAGQLGPGHQDQERHHPDERHLGVRVQHVARDVDEQLERRPRVGHTQQRGGLLGDDDDADGGEHAVHHTRRHAGGDDPGAHQGQHNLDDARHDTHRQHAPVAE
jgi:hypothetical protein